MIWVISRDFVCASYGSSEGRVSKLNEQYRILRDGGVAAFTTMANMERHGYHGMPPESDIRRSHFNSSEQKEIVLDLNEVSDGFPKFTFPVRYFRK